MTPEQMLNDQEKRDIELLSMEYARYVEGEAIDENEAVTYEAWLEHRLVATQATVTALLARMKELEFIVRELLGGDNGNVS